MKIILIIIGVALGMIQTVAFAAEEPAWSLEGRSITVDSCGVDCHCLIGGPPDNGLCQFFLIAQIDNGQYAGVNLDGVKFAQAAEFVQKMMGEQPKFTFTAYYIDSGASAEQREALRKLFIGSSPHAMGQPAEVKEIAINSRTWTPSAKSEKRPAAPWARLPKWRSRQLPGSRTQTSRW